MYEHRDCFYNIKVIQVLGKSRRGNKYLILCGMIRNVFPAVAVL